MTRIECNGIAVEDGEVEVDLAVEGPDLKAETVEMHVHDEIVKALQAVESGKEPDECDGYIMRPNWEVRLQKIKEANE